MKTEFTHGVWILLLIAILTACGQEDAYRIEGNLTHMEGETVYAVFEGEDTKAVDTVTCTKPGQFLIEHRDGDFTEATLYLGKKTEWITLYLKKGEKIRVTGDANYPSLLRVKGGRINEQLTAMKKELAPLLKEEADLMHQLQGSKRTTENKEIETTDVVSRMANLRHQLSEAAVNVVKRHPNEEASVILIKQYCIDPDDTRQIDELLAILSPKLNDFEEVKKLRAYSERAHRTDLGAEAPDFKVINIYGEPVSLDSFPQKYLLLAFTAPWCDMCQTEDLFLDQVATNYSKEKVDMLLISLDDTQAEVRHMIDKDSISWNLVTDSGGQATQLFDLYNVRALPRCYLIDEEGKIILKTDNGVEIKQTLEQLIQ